MTKADLVDRIHARTRFTKRKSAELLATLFSAMTDAIVSGDTVRITGFGTFTVRQKHARQGCNPQTGECVMIAPRRVLTYKPSKVLKNDMNGIFGGEE